MRGEKSKIKFGESLKLLISALDISISRLSKAINVDTSLANRWVNEKRIPSYNTPYIENIAEYLSKNIQNSYQLECLKRIIGSHMDISEENISSDNIKEVIFQFLNEAHGYSRECKKNEQRIKSYAREQKIDLKNINADYLDHLELSNEDKIIPGIGNIINQGISLIETAANIKGTKENNTIYLTCLSEIYTYNFDFEDRQRCINALLKAIENGWNIVFLIRLNDNKKRTANFINYVRPLIKTSKLSIYYTKNYVHSGINDERLIIPGVGAMSSLLTSISLNSYHAFYFKNKAAVEIMNENMQSILSSASKLLTHYYFYGDKKEDSSFYLMEIEEKMGNRFLYKFCFSVLTMPEEIFVKLLKRVGLPEDEIIIELYYYKTRLKSFIQNLKDSEYRDICLLESIEKLIKERQYHLYTRSGVYLVDMEVGDIIEYLENIIKLLEKYENYHIGFISNDNKGFDNNYFCYVKERQAAFFGAFNSSTTIPEHRILITEPMSVKALAEYFEELWENMAPVNKNKSDIIQWLNRYITLLKRQL